MRHNVAVAMAGELRTLAHAWSNLQAALLVPLRADLFMDVSSVDETLLRVLRPVHAHVAAGEPENTSTYYGLFTRWARLHGAIEAHERRVHSRYEWIVRVRPDLLYTCRISLGLLAQSRGRSLLKWDLVAVLPRDAAAAALTVGSRRSNCRCEGLADLCIPSVLYAHKKPFALARGRVVFVGGPTTDKSGFETCRPGRTSEAARRTNATKRHAGYGGDEPCFSPDLIAVILRDGAMPAPTRRVANGTYLPSCSAQSFRTPDAWTLISHYDEAGCTRARGLRALSRRQVLLICVAVVLIGGLLVALCVL